MIHIEDYEYEAQKDLVYLQEDIQALYRSLNDPGKVIIEAFMNHKVDLNDLQMLQEEARINICIPESLINKIDSRINKSYEHKIDSFSFQRTTEERI